MQHIQIPKTIHYDNYNDYQNELLNFTDFLKAIHPAFLIDNEISIKIDLLALKLCKQLKYAANISLSDFQIILNKVLVKLCDAHSFISIDTDNLFPVDFRYYNEAIFVYHIAKEYSHFEGMVVAKINDIEIDEIKSRLANIIPAENDIKVGINGSYILNNSSVLSAIGIMTDNNYLKLSLDGGEEVVIPINLQNSQKNKKSIKMHPITYKRDVPFSYCIDKGICYFQFNQMLDRVSYEMYCDISGIEIDNQTLRQLPSFVDFINDMYCDMDSNKVDLLVVDMRNNGGGNSLLGDALLESLGINLESINRYSTYTRVSEFLTSIYPMLYSKVVNQNDNLINQDQFFDLDKYYNRFKISKQFNKKVVFIQGNNTFSSANYLLTTIQDNKLFNTIGLPTSQKPTSYGDVIPILLPYTRSKGYISHSVFMRPDSSKSYKVTLSPDIYINTTIAEHLNGIDKCWQWIINNN